MVLGLFAILAGGVMLFAGQFVIRLVLPIWSFLAGFAFGAGLFSELADERFLGTVLCGVTGLVFALVVAVFAYLICAVAVVLAMAAFGFAICSGLVVALGIDWNWIVGSLGSADFTQVSFTDAIPDGWGWSLLLLMLAVAGIVAQTRQQSALRGPVEETWQPRVDDPTSALWGLTHSGWSACRARFVASGRAENDANPLSCHF